MKRHPQSPQARRGYALLTVVMLIAIMAALSASILGFSVSERRANERHRLLLRARNMAENISVYAAEQLTTKLYRLRSTTPMAFIGGSNEIALPPADVLTSSFSTTAGMEVRAGLTSSTGLAFIDPLVAANANNPNAGLSASTSTVPIVAKATMNHPQIGEVTAYCQHDLEVAMIPLFQFAIFYNMDLEFGPGANMTISGPVHTNGSFIARGQSGFSNTVEFTDRVTAVNGFYANTGHKGPTYMDTGAADHGPGGSGPLYFTAPSGTKTDVKSGGGVWRDHKYGNASESATTLTQFKTFATSTYSGNLRTSVHGVTPLVLPSVSNYLEVDDPTTPADERNNGRQIIEAPDAGDSAGLKETKFARKAGLYIVVNPDDETRTGTLPDASTVSMRARSYRSWLNTVNSDGTHTLSEVILPGQPSYGPLNAYVNNLPNAFRADTSVTHNQILRIPKGGGVDLPGTGYAGPAIPTYPTLTDSYFYDMRRATGNRGYPFGRSSSSVYTPRPIAKIDFDFVRFKMAVERTLLGSTTSSVYYPARPYNSATWNASIFNSSAAPASHGLGVGAAFDAFPASEAAIAIQKATASGTPPAMTIESWTQTGSAGAISTYAGRFVIHDTNSTTLPAAGSSSWVQQYSSSANESSTTYAPAADRTFVRIRQYMAGGITTLIDEQTIPIVHDTAANAVIATLSNERYIVPCTNSTSGFIFPNATTEMRVYVDGADDTANWNFSAATASGSVTGSIVGNRYTANGISTASGTSTGTVTITASRAGYTSVSKTFTLVKQSSISGLTPSQTGRWVTATVARHIDPFQIYFAPADPADPDIAADPGTFAVGSNDLVNLSGASPWFDGITVYIHSVDAENRSSARVDSGVRLWNGRGPVISLDGSTYPGRTGFSLATNDPVYVVGHFNADGTINASVTSTGVGGYSGRYPESINEKLTSIMGDAITILSQPVFDSSYVQTTGWSDSLSAHRRDASASWSSSWRTTDPSTSNRQDGINDGVTAAPHPTLGVATSGSRTSKFSPTPTEISTCFLIGIVPTNHNPTGLTNGAPSPGANGQTSGGVHNYPRLQEHWNTTPLYIRGSMVAMFESRVAMEPWSIRFYTGAGRFWGLHESLRDANHDLPLEPMLLNARRMGFRELNSAEYAAKKAAIEALPH